MRKVGLSALDDSKLKQFNELSQTLLEKKTAELTTQLSLFKSILLSFFEQNKDTIAKNSELKLKLFQVCRNLNIDPLIILDKSTDFNQFYYELGLKIIEFNDFQGNIKYGGLIPIKEILLSINENLDNKIKQDDLQISIDLLKVLNEEIDIITLNNQKYIKLLQISLSSDKVELLKIVNEIGHISISILRDNLNWNIIKCKEVLNELVSNGYLWIDKGNKGEVLYWDPSWINRF